MRIMSDAPRREPKESTQKVSNTKGANNDDGSSTRAGQDLPIPDTASAGSRRLQTRRESCCRKPDAARRRRGLWQRLVSRRGDPGRRAAQQELASAGGATRRSAGSGAEAPDQAPKIGQPIRWVSALSAIRSRWELPLASRPGGQTAIEALPVFANAQRTPRVNTNGRL